MDKSIIGILGFALGGISSISWGILIVTKIFPNIDKKLKINQLDFFKFLGAIILFGIGATLFFYARNENLEIAKISFYFSFGISFLCFSYIRYNSYIEKNIEEKEIFVAIIGFVFALIGVIVFFKNGFYIDVINGVRNGK